jgi:aromatic ring-opening dioxygenase catalytic subunit (LigB family)
MKDLISETIGRLKDADKNLTEAIASGSNIHNFDTYQKLVGKREGLQEALSIINEILNEDNSDL